MEQLYHTTPNNYMTEHYEKLIAAEVVDFSGGSEPQFIIIADVPEAVDDDTKLGKDGIWHGTFDVLTCCLWDNKREAEMFLDMQRYAAAAHPPIKDRRYVLVNGEITQPLVELSHPWEPAKFAAIVNIDNADTEIRWDEHGYCTSKDPDAANLNLQSLYRVGEDQIAAARPLPEWHPLYEGGDQVPTAPPEESCEHGLPLSALGKGLTIKPTHHQYAHLLENALVVNQGAKPKHNVYKITVNGIGSYAYELGKDGTFYQLVEYKNAATDKGNPEREWYSYDEAKIFLAILLVDCKAEAPVSLWGGNPKTFADPHPVLLPFDKTDPKGAAGDDKTPLQLIPLNALAPIAEVLKLGKIKYGERNWITSEGVSMQTYRGAILRHQAAIDRGEDIDPESGISHWAHIAASCLIVIDAELNDQLIDNRVWLKPKQPTK